MTPYEKLKLLTKQLYNIPSNQKPILPIVFGVPMPSFSNPSINRGPSAWTFEDFFDGTDDWTDTGTNVAVNTTTDVIDYTVDTDNTGTEYDLGGAIDNTKWLLRFKFVCNSLTNGGNHQMIFGIFSASGADNTTPSQDFLGLRTVVTTTLNRYDAYYGDGVVMNGGSATSFATSLTSSDTYYVEIIRTSATQFTVELFSDSGFSTSVEKETVTIASTIQDLRYIKAISMKFSDGGVNVGTIDDVQFVDGFTVPP